MTARSLLPGLGLALALVAGCTTGEDEDNLPSTTFAGGRVLLAGPDVVLRNAALSVAQIKYLGPPPTVEINVHVDDTTTGPDGRFFIDGGQASGQYRLTFRGGEFTDPGTGQVVRLDQADELVTYMDVKIGSRIENHVVSPASVITARVAEQRFATGQDTQFEKSLAFARAHVDAYLGGVAWEFVQPADLTRPAPSPTEAVRAAWLLGAFDLLARDMATAANASPSEVNVHKLLQAWSTDLGAADRPTFDGNDADARGGGLRLGSECPAPDPACVPPPGCATGACRPRCELYSGSARISLAEAMYGYAKRTAAGHGLPDSDALAAARALQAVNDPLLFAPTACVEDLDRAGPSIVFELPDAAVTDVAGTLTVRARAMDMLDLTPGLTLSVDGATLPDDDGDPNDGLATATIDTQARSGTLKVTARAVDDAGNATTLDRMWLVDNAAPTLTVLVDGFLDDGAAWWIRPIAMPPNVPTGPRLTGTVDDAHLRDVRARVGGNDVATATVTGNAWELTLPDGTVPGAAPVTVELVARDHAGHATTLTRVLRRDATPPVLTVESTGYFVDGAGAWWPLPTGSPPAVPPALTLVGTITEDHLVDLVAKVGGATVATATVNGQTWTLTLPVGTVPGLAPVVVDVVATDRAGQSATVSKTLRRDDSAPVLAVEPSTVRSERPAAPASQGETVTFDGSGTYKVVHIHGSPAQPLALDAATCAGAPTGWMAVAKYAYLLDDVTPTYVQELGGRNPIVWKWRVTDDGVGVAGGAVRYRVRDSAGTDLTGWRPVPAGAVVVEMGVITGAHYEVELHRGGVDAIPQLGQGGAFRVELEATDRLGRPVTTARCIQIELLPTPVDFGAPQAATNGGVGSGKFGLSAGGLSLAGSVIEHPFAAQVLNPTTSGNGLMEYRVTNPTTEDAYLTIDFTKPTTASTTVSYRRDQPMYFDAQPADFYCSAATPCGAAPGPGTLVSNQMSAAVPRYGVQVWSVDRSPMFPVWTRVPECATCNLTPPTTAQVRTTVMLPGRATPAAPAAEYWVVPVAYELVGLRPGSAPPYEDRDGWSGKVTGGGSYCSVAVDDGIGLHCDELTSYQKVNFVTRATFSLSSSAVVTDALLSRSGGLVDQPVPPLYLNAGAGLPRRLDQFPDWVTTE